MSYFQSLHAYKQPPRSYNAPFAFLNFVSSLCSCPPIVLFHLSTCTRAHAICRNSLHPTCQFVVLGRGHLEREDFRTKIPTRRSCSDTCFWLSEPSHLRRGKHKWCLTNWSAPSHRWRCGDLDSDGQRELDTLDGVKCSPTWTSRRGEGAGYRCKRRPAERGLWTHQS